jgi:hypothetical protein
LHLPRKESTFIAMPTFPAHSKTHSPGGRT